MEQKSSISKQSECKDRVCNYLQYVCDMQKFSSVEVNRVPHNAPGRGAIGEDSL